MTRFVEVVVEAKFLESVYIELEEGKTIESMTQEQVKMAVLEQDADGSFSALATDHLSIINIGCEFTE